MEPSLPRNVSVGSFLDLRDVNIAADELVEDEAGAEERRCSSDGRCEAATPRAAPCISLPKQNRESLTHFAIGTLLAFAAAGLYPRRHASIRRPAA